MCGENWVEIRGGGCESFGFYLVSVVKFLGVLVSAFGR